MSQSVQPRAYRRIVQEIRSDIFAGRRVPGERLPTEPALGEQHGVSRAGVREAMRVLELQGFIQVRHGHAGGAFVAAPSATPLLGALEDSLRRGAVDVDELYQARRGVEPTVARLAIERDAAGLAAALEANVEQTRHALSEGDVVSALNREFHSIVAARAGNRVLELMMQVLQELLERLDLQRPNAPGVSRCALADHEQLLAAMRASDADRAEELMRAHLAQLEGRLSKVLSADEVMSDE